VVLLGQSNNRAYFITRQHTEKKRAEVITMGVQSAHTELYFYVDGVHFALF